MSLCESCRGLEIWPGMWASRYLCGYRLGEHVKEFGEYGRPCAKGIPKVKRCSEYAKGKHYSRRETK